MDKVMRTKKILNEYREAKWQNILIQIKKEASYSEDTSLSRMDVAMEMLRKEPNNGETYYWILYYAYLSEMNLSVTEISHKLKKEGIVLSRSYYFKLKQRAIQVLSEILDGWVI